MNKVRVLFFILFLKIASRYISYIKYFFDSFFHRAQCMKLVVAITILTCNSDSERAEILNKWIQVAVDTKTALGNLFGFSNIMLGLMLPQVKLEAAIILLSQDIGRHYPDT